MYCSSKKKESAPSSSAAATTDWNLVGYFGHVLGSLLLARNTSTSTMERKEGGGWGRVFL